MESWKIYHWIEVFQIGFCRDELQVKTMKYCFINNWKSKYKSSVNKIYGWYKACQNIENWVAKLSNLDVFNCRMQTKGELRCQGSCPYRVLHEKLHRLGCSSAPGAHSPLVWHASLSEENDMLALLLAPEPVSLSGYCYTLGCLCKCAHRPAEVGPHK